MKFQKFVKALGSDGIVYNRKNGERWLASERVFMKIPEDIRSVTCADTVEMYAQFDTESETSEGKALVIKRPACLVSDEEVIGLIFPTDYEE